jgi:acylphosphatase
MLRATVSGRVQGVGFRYYVCRTARALGITGWVKNNPDRTVSLEAFGPRASLNDLVKRISVGPTRARVDNVAVQWITDSESQNQFVDFSAR